jgi:flagellar basal body-associated protein FliL
MTTPQDPGYDPQQGANPYGPQGGVPPTGGAQPPGSGYGTPGDASGTPESGYGTPESGYGTPTGGYPPAGSPPPPGSVPPGGAPPSYSGGGYGGYQPPPKKRNTGLIIGAIVAALVILTGVAVGVFALRGGDDTNNADETAATSAPTTSTSTSTDTPTTEAPTTSEATAYCEKLKTIDHDTRLIGLNTKNADDVQYAIDRFHELGGAAPSSIKADWVKVNDAIEKAFRGQTPSITSTQLQTAFDNIKAEAQTDCSYTLRGGPFGS